MKHHVEYFAPALDLPAATANGETRMSNGHTSSAARLTGPAGAIIPGGGLIVDGYAPEPLPARRAGPVPQVQVHLLGPALITGAVSELQPKMGELVYALALNTPPGLSGSALATMLGPDPDHAKPADGLRQVITRTRRRLGTTPDGGEYITYRNGRYSLSGGWLDWNEFAILAVRGRDTGNRQALRAALNLVRGQPCDGIFFWWLEPAVIESMRADVTDAAALLARLELDAGDPAAAGRAARVGLAADPAAEHLWRAVMEAEYAVGNITGVHQAWRLLRAAIAAISPGGQPHPDSVALYQDLTQPQSAAPSRAAPSQPSHQQHR